MFLNKDDLKTNLYTEILTQISRFSQEVITMHLMTAESEIEVHLCPLYNIRPELEKTGDSRNKLLVQIGVGIAVWYIYQNQETIPDKVQKAYDRAAKLLEMLAAQKIRLPGVEPAPVTPETPTVGGIAFGSNPRRASLY